MRDHNVCCEHWVVLLWTCVLHDNSEYRSQRSSWACWLWTGAAAEILRASISPIFCVCVYAHVPGRTGLVWVFVCAYDHRCKHVCTVSDNVLLCGEKPDSQGHSSSASSCFISAPPITLISGDMWKTNNLTNHRQLHLFTSHPMEDKIKEIKLAK